MLFFFFNDTATTEIYTLSLHDALPISDRFSRLPTDLQPRTGRDAPASFPFPQDRKSTRLNSSHANISYAVFCLKKKKKNAIEKRSPTNPDCCLVVCECVPTSVTCASLS